MLAAAFPNIFAWDIVGFGAGTVVLTFIIELLTEWELSNDCSLSDIDVLCDMTDGRVGPLRLLGVLVSSECE